MISPFHMSTSLGWEQRQTRTQTLPCVCRAAEVKDPETVRLTSTSSDAITQMSKLTVSSLNSEE